MSSPILSRAVALLVWGTLVPAAFCGDLQTVADQKGRSLIIQLVSLSGESVTFKRQGEDKEYKLPISQFDQGSQDRIRKQAEEMAAAGAQKPPAAADYKIQPGIVIGKRRRDKGDSYYMENQEITSTVKLANLSTTVRADGLMGAVIYIGRNTGKPDIYSVLSTQKFKASVDASGSFSKEMDSFTTTYDSDNKGAGNLGGYQYYGYVLALFDSKGELILTETTTGSFRMALAAKKEFVDAVLTYPKGATISDKLEPKPGGGAY